MVVESPLKSTAFDPKQYVRRTLSPGGQDEVLYFRIIQVRIVILMTIVVPHVYCENEVR